MTLKTLNKTTWDEIKVGEVFAWDGCWFIFEKDSEDTMRALASDRPGYYLMDEHKHFWNSPRFSGSLYKLPLSTQRLWRCDT